MNVKDIDISTIKIGERFRRDPGDIEDLAQSIDQLGLLHPIVINEKHQLICGERRLLAFKALERKTIPCQVVNINLLAGEFSENIYRQPFTPTERKAIADAVAREMEQHRGRPNKENVPHGAQLPRGTKTRDIAAKRAGFTSKNQLQRVAKVLEMGAPETVKAMDEGRISIRAAADIAEAVPKEKQTAILAMPKDELKQAARDARAELEAKRKSDEQLQVGIFHEKVKEIGSFYMEAVQFWQVNSRRYAEDLPADLERAVNTLHRLLEGHPSAAAQQNKPQKVR